MNEREGPARQRHISFAERLQAATLRRVKPWFQLDNVVYERRRDLPRVGIAALAVEAYLPFQ